MQEQGSKIICLGGWSNSSNIGGNVVAEVHNVFGKTEINYSNLPAYLKRHSTAKVENFVYCIGGASDATTVFPTNAVYRIDVNYFNDQNTTWSKVKPLNKTRDFFASAVVDNNIVVAGGLAILGPCALVELYEEHMDSWRNIASMIDSRYGHALIEFKGSLIALGGSGAFHNPLSSTEILHDLDGKWKLLQPMNFDRYRLAAVVCDGMLYAIGGKSQSGILNSVEKYDFESKSWSFVRNMNFPRWRHSACVLRGRIFVVGGQENTSGKYVSQMEYYNPKTDKWTIICDPNIEVCEHALVVL